MLHGPIQTLREIKARCDERFGKSYGSPVFQNRKAMLRERLVRRSSTGESFSEATDELDRARLLLSIYLDELGKADAQSWLPPFDQQIALDLLGSPGTDLPFTLARQLAHLFFTHFDKLEGLLTVCQRLQDAYTRVDDKTGSQNRTWSEQREHIFSADGPAQLAKNAHRNESFTQLSKRFALPSSGRFSARLKEVLLLSQLERAEIGQGQDILKQIEPKDVRESPFEAGIPLGAAALRIMTKKVLASRGEWLGDWPDWLLRLGCDPSLPARSESFGKWWGCWHPTPAEIRCAQRAVNRQTLEYFIQFLEESLRQLGKSDQFESRAGFLRWLDDTQKIEQFKLVLHPTAFSALPQAYRQQRHRVAKLDGSGQGTSVIVMKCTDGIWIIEGTHSYAVRVFQHECPVAAIFDEIKVSYPFEVFTQGPMHRDRSRGIWKAHMSNWLPELLRQIGRQYHLEWNLKPTSKPAHLAPNQVSRVPSPPPIPAVAAPLAIRATPTSNVQLSPRSLTPDAAPHTDLGVDAVTSVVEDYIQQLSSYLSLSGNKEVSTRAKLLRALVEQGKIEAARLVTDMNERSMLVMRCTNGMTLVDAVHYLNLRGLCDKGALWDAVDRALHNGARLAILRGGTDYQLHVSHLPPEGYAKRFLDQLAENCGVTWDDVMF